MSARIDKRIDTQDRDLAAGRRVLDLETTALQALGGALE